jgi:hypothetical protein
MAHLEIECFAVCKNFKFRIHKYFYISETCSLLLAKDGRLKSFETDYSRKSLDESVTK